MMMSMAYHGRGLATTGHKIATRSLSSTFLPRLTERRDGEAGPGGRSSVAGLKVAVFGASGFLGRYVCENLGVNGTLTYLGNRGDDFEMRWLKPMFDLGRSKFVFYSSRDRQSMADVIADADVVINLIGKYYETKTLADKPTFPYLEYKTNFGFQETNVDIPRTIAELCTEMQVDNLIHVSCAAAKPDSSSEWARTKYEGEQAVKEAFPWATIVRPTQLFGPEDKLLLWFANAPNRIPYFVPLIEGGEALTQPVHVLNVAETITRILDDPELFEGRTVDCFGPADFTYKELSEFVYDITGQNARVVDLPKPLVKQISSVIKYWGNPQLTPDLVELWSEDFLPAMTAEQYKAQKGANKILTMEDVGVKANPIEKEAFNYLHRFREGGHFIDAKGYH
uniref:NAD-dependent epimerase/dehydratase domain-containing protein n=1 Tax=Attheya septentrionalis TaxID=420275 RepID=A0A7S2UDV5_9STRA|mmetsp:Transcript_21323/g.38551  ORF Transcript_21323/g.38551 Transcript_21323/m.38551 type:complete len:395 (+) Transcript_21323:63-1247(+)